MLLNNIFDCPISYRYTFININVYKTIVYFCELGHTYAIQALQDYENTKGYQLWSKGGEHKR